MQKKTAFSTLCLAVLVGVLFVQAPSFAQPASTQNTAEAETTSLKDLSLIVEDLKRSVNALVGTTLPTLEQQATDLKSAIKDNATTTGALEANVNARLTKIEADITALQALVSKINGIGSRVTALENSSFTPSVAIRTRTEDRDVFTKGILLSCNVGEVVTGCQNNCSHGGDDTYAYPIDSKTCRGAASKNSTHKGTCTLVATCLKTK